MPDPRKDEALSTEIPMLPDGCGYQGYEFGASYPDSICFGGRLYDADAYDDGMYRELGEYVPCPMCHYYKAIDWWKNRNRATGMNVAEAQIAARALVRDIRRNRKNGTEPWKRGKLGR